MTLKQFFQLAGGILVGLIFYSTPLPGLIKWPFIIVSVLLGVGMAFVPLEERPLESWLIAFFRTIYSPTIFSWKKTATQQKFFQNEDQSSVNQVASVEQTGTTKTDAKNLNPLAKLDVAEQGFLAKLSSIFSIAKPVLPQATQPPTNNQVVQTLQTPVPAQQPRKLEIPVSNPIKVTPQLSHLVVEEKVKPAVQTQTVQTQNISPVIAGNEIVSTKEAIFSIDAAPPNPPTTPNVIVGQVVDEVKHIIEGAIIEVRDEYGRPIRALRSNKLGHFLAVTPLDPGKYSIVTEKDNYQFTPVNFEAKGQIIPPILVQGKRLSIPTNGTLNQGQHAFIN